MYQFNDQFGYEKEKKNHSINTLELQCAVNVTWYTKTTNESPRNPQFDHENKMAAPIVNSAIRFQSNLHWHESLFMYKINQKQQTVKV